MKSLPELQQNYENARYHFVQVVTRPNRINTPEDADDFKKALETYQKANQELRESQEKGLVGKIGGKL
jgi:hypothetical protein